MGVAVPAQVLTVPEAVQARLNQPGISVFHRSGSIYLVMSCAETYQLQSDAAREVLEYFGITCVGIPKYQPYHRSSFPEGLALDLDPTPDQWFARKIAETAQIKRPDAIVCTTGQAWKAMQAAYPDIPVVHWSGFVLNQMV
jgi:hypothetical protein